LTPQSSLFIINAELKGVPVSALIEFGAQKCFISFEAAARLHSSGRKKTDVPVRTRGASGEIKDRFESFPEALLTLNGHTTILEAPSLMNDTWTIMVSRQELSD
jgi:hypothetical protein